MPLSNTSHEENRSILTDELRLIPQWSIGLAIFSFVAVQYIFWVVMPAHTHHPGAPRGLHAFFAISWGEYAVLNALAIGYVSKDALRRGMSRPFWMLVCLLAPGGVGAVLYFLMRQPIISTCPACATPVHSDYHFCPQCNFHLSASCGICYRGARLTDLYCVHCGHDLAQDNTPERLRVFHG